MSDKSITTEKLTEEVSNELDLIDQFDPFGCIFSKDTDVEDIPKDTPQFDLHNWLSNLDDDTKEKLTKDMKPIISIRKGLERIGKKWSKSLGGSDGDFLNLNIEDTKVVQQTMKGLFVKYGFENIDGLSNS